MQEKEHDWTKLAESLETEAFELDRYGYRFPALYNAVVFLLEAEAVRKNGKGNGHDAVEESNR